MRVPAISLATNLQITDEQIVDRIKQGEKEMYEVLIRRHNLKLYRVARGILKDEEEIQDVMQEAYLKAFEKLHQFQGRSAFATWLTRIVINSALARFNEKKRMHFLDIETVKEEGDFMEEDSSFEPTPEMGPKIKKAVEAAIDSLPPRYRSVFMLREIENMTVADTSFCLDISEENVKVRLHRAKEMLRSLIRDSFGGADLFGFQGQRCDAITEGVMNKILLSRQA